MLGLIDSAESDGQTRWIRPSASCVACHEIERPVPFPPSPDVALDESGTRRRAAPMNEQTLPTRGEAHLTSFQRERVLSPAQDARPQMEAALTQTVAQAFELYGELKGLYWTLALANSQTEPAWGRTGQSAFCPYRQACATDPRVRRGETNQSSCSRIAAPRTRRAFSGGPHPAFGSCPPADR